MQTYTQSKCSDLRCRGFCRVILTSYLLIKCLNPACFCSKPSTVCWMTKNHSLSWLLKFGQWTVVMRVHLTPLQLQRQRCFCRVGTRLCNEPSTTACPGEETNLLWNTANVCPWPFTLRGTPVLLLQRRSTTFQQMWGVPWEKTQTWYGKAGGMTELQEIKWSRKRKLNGWGRFCRYVFWGLQQIWPHSTWVSPVCASMWFHDARVWGLCSLCILTALSELGKCYAHQHTGRQREQNYWNRVSESLQLAEISSQVQSKSIYHIWSCYRTRSKNLILESKIPIPNA